MRALLLCLALLLAGCATTREGAINSGWGDVGSTALALGAGASEANPLGVAGVLLKPLAIAHADGLPEEERAAGYASIAAIWGAGTANNLCLAVTLALGQFYLTPICPMVGLGYGFQTWDNSAHERELWAICKGHRDYWKNPDLPCTFIPSRG